TGWFALPAAVVTRCATLTIAEAPGEVAELAVQTEADPQKLARPAGAELVAQGASGNPDRSTITPERLNRLRAALRGSDEQAGTSAAHELIAVGAPAAELPAQLLSDPSAPLAARKRAASVLAALKYPPAFAGLLAAAGTGPPELRRAIVDAASD